MPKTSPEESFHARLAVIEKRAWLRPQGTGEVIDTALRVYQRSAWLILRLTAVPMVACLVAVVFYQTIVLPGLFTTRTQGSVTGELSEVVSALLIGVFIAGPLFCFGLGRAAGTVVSVSADILHGRPLELAKAQTAASKATGAVASALALVLATSMIGVAVAGVFALGSMLLERSGPPNGLWSGLSGVLAFITVVVGIITIPIAWNSRALAPVAAVLENKGGKDSVRRSRNLMRYYRGHPMAEGVTISVAFILLIFGFPLYSSLQALIEAVGLKGLLLHWTTVPGLGQMLAGVAGGLPVYVSMWLLLPLWPTAMTVLYYDRIVRFEAYDVQVMLEDLKVADRRAVLLR